MQSSLHQKRHNKLAAHLRLGPVRYTIIFPRLLRTSAMDTNSPRRKGRDDGLSSLNVATEALNLVRDLSGIAPAKAVFGSVGALLTMLRVRFPPLCGDKLQVDVYPGLHGQRNRLCRARTNLRRHL